PMLGDPHCNVFSATQRLDDTRQRATGSVYIGGFLRVYVGGEGQFLPLFTAAAPPPASALTTLIFPAFHPAGFASERRDVNRLLNPATDLTTSTIGGAVAQSGLSPFSLCGGPGEPAQCLSGQSTDKQPHTTPGFTGLLTPGASQLTTGWNSASATL